VDLPIDRVAIDNVRAAQLAVGHLIGMGRRRIAVIGQNPHLRAAEERGLRVPEDIAIVGFDGTEESAYSRPSLTTITACCRAAHGAAVWRGQRVCCAAG
jgi:DNA-binding LacI/PurR family transcriptional regulator